MSAFLTPLNLEMMMGPLEIGGKKVENVPQKNREGRQFWRLITPFAYQSDVIKNSSIVPDGVNILHDGIMMVRAGFVTDLASIPRLPLVYRELNGEADVPGVPHDFAYSTGILPRDTADLMLKEACFLIGLPAWKVWAIYAGVRVGGQSHYMRS